MFKWIVQILLRTTLRKLTVFNFPSSWFFHDGKACVWCCGLLLQSCGDETVGEVDLPPRSHYTGLCPCVPSCGQEVAILWSQAVHGKGNLSMVPFIINLITCSSSKMYQVNSVPGICPVIIMNLSFKCRCCWLVHVCLCWA